MQENVFREKKCSGGGPPEPLPLLPRLNYASGYGPAVPLDFSENHCTFQYYFNHYVITRVSQCVNPKKHMLVLGHLRQYLKLLVTFCYSFDRQNIRKCREISSLNRKYIKVSRPCRGWLNSYDCFSFSVSFRRTGDCPFQALMNTYMYVVC